MRRLLPLSALVLVVAACGGIGSPGFTIPPINLPSIPPINFSIPPIGGLPSGGGIELPPGAIPTGSVPCGLVTGAEVAQIMGTTFTDASDGATNCTFVSNSFATLSVSSDDSTDLQGVQFLLGNTAQQINVGGFPGLSGTFMGLPVVYVQKPSGQLQVLGFLAGNDPNMIAKLQQVAQIAVGRMP